MSYYDLSKKYIQYCDDILNHNIPACEDVILACQRFKSWFHRDDVYFDYEDVDRRIRLVSKLRHFRGEFNKKPFIMLPFQEFIFAGIFGFKYIDTKLRVTKNVLIFIARKNAKTSLAAAICLTQLLLDNNNGQEIDFIASSGAQAHIGFDITKNYAESIDPKGLIFKRFRDTIRMPITKSEIAVRNSDAMTLDGLQSATFIADEIHAYKTPDLWNVMKSSQGSQKQPLSIGITTAGFLLEGYFLYEWVKVCKDILRGHKDDDSQFTMLYSLDDGDDWADESTWIKANPALYDIVSIDYLRDQCHQAKNQPSLEVGFKTKLLNLFCQSSDVWLPDKLISDNMTHIDITKLQNETCYMGVDLSAVSDLTCTSVMWPPNKSRSYYPDKFIFKTISYLPEDQLKISINKNIYQNAQRQNAIQITPGNVVDYDYILEDQIAINNSMDLMVCAYDQWNSTQWALSAERAGINLGAFSQSLGSFNKPTKDFERLLKQGDVIIDDNMITRWCFQNVVLKHDWNDNLKPTKETYPQKIDAVIAMLEALGAYISDVNNADPD